MNYRCPLPILTQADTDIDDDSPRPLILKECGADIMVAVKGGWAIDSTDGTAGGDCEKSMTVECVEGHVLLTVYDDTNHEIVPITDDWVQQAVEFIRKDPTSRPRPALLLCPHCGRQGEQADHIWHDPACWWVTHE